jgi:hypothetical protein
LEWADEYYAVSVSESALSSVRAYIDNQDAHHAKAPFGEEVAAFLREHNFAGQG